MIVLTLPYPVSANRYWTAVHTQQRTMMVPSKEAKVYKAQVQRIAAEAGLREPMATRLEMWIRLYPERPADWAKRARLDPQWDNTVRCIDLGNCEKVLSDALQGSVFSDDKWIWRQHKERMPPDERGARVVVAVRPLAPVQPAQQSIVA